MSYLESALLIIILIYTRPLSYFRYKFRSIVYGDKKWTISIRPWFWKETKAIFSNQYFKTKKEKEIAKYYRLYLVGFFILVTALKFS